MYEKLPIDLVVNFALVKDDKILLEKGSIGWKLPGGHVEPMEEPHNAVKREAKEELGIEVNFLSSPLFPTEELHESLPTPFASYRHTLEKDGTTKSKHKNVCFAYLVSSETEPKSLEGQELSWLTLTQVKNSQMNPIVKAICKVALSTPINKK
jgi:8-oxo-dGTP pyrophosphatase MutT (NUDIX family)